MQYLQSHFFKTDSLIECTNAYMHKSNTFKGTNFRIVRANFCKHFTSSRKLLLRTGITREPVFADSVFFLWLFLLFLFFFQFSNLITLFYFSTFFGELRTLANWFSTIFLIFIHSITNIFFFLIKDNLFKENLFNIYPFNSARLYSFTNRVRSFLFIYQSFLPVSTR